MALGPTLVATGGSDKTVTLWSRATGQRVRTITGHAGSIRALLMDEPSGCVFSASFDTSVRKWDLATGKCAYVCNMPHTASVTCLAGNALYLLSGSKDKTVRVWQRGTGLITATVKLGSAVRRLVAHWFWWVFFCCLLQEFLPIQATCLCCCEPTSFALIGTEAGKLLFVACYDTNDAGGSFSGQ
jgi:WD40 repeat protein